jgi:hypothetical protein
VCAAKQIYFCKLFLFSPIAFVPKVDLVLPHVMCSLWAGPVHRSKATVAEQEAQKQHETQCLQEVEVLCKDIEADVASWCAAKDFG